MGTHPIFESDFDCLTEMVDISEFAENELDSESKIIQYVSENRDLENAVRDQQMILASKSINVEVIMREFSSIGKLLQIADMGTDKMKSNLAVKNIMMKYQGMVNDCSTSLLFFREACLSSIENIQEGILYFEDDEFSDAVECLSENSEKIKQMTERTDLLITATKELSALAVKAVGEVTSDQTASEDQRKAFKEKIDKIRADQAQQEEEGKQTEELIQKIQNEINAALKRADNAASREHMLQITQMIVTPLSDVASTFLTPFRTVVTTAKDFFKKDDVKKVFNETPEPALLYEEMMRTLTLRKEEAKNDPSIDKKNIEELDKQMKHITDVYEKKIKEISKREEKSTRESTRLYELAAKKEELIHQQRMNLIKLNAKIKKQTLQLEQQKDQIGDAERAVEMLAMAMHVLAKIRTTLEHLKQFWEMQHQECITLKENSEKQIKHMKKMEKLANNEQKEENRKSKDNTEKMLRKSIKKAIINWITLYQLNANGFASIKESQHVIDAAVCSFGQIDQKTAKMRSAEEIHAIMNQLLKDFNAVENDTPKIEEAKK